MKPLTLVLKAYLNAQRLNDVATGGLSSYSLCNMVIAHLQEELKVRPGGLSSYSQCNMVIAHLQEELKVRPMTRIQATSLAVWLILIEKPTDWGCFQATLLFV